MNGNWGAFGNYGTCTKSCGGGTQTRYRACNRPAPAHGGKSCAGSSSSWKTCNTHACPGRETSLLHAKLLAQSICPN